MQEKPLNITQSRVFKYMQDFGSITTIQAITDLGETRLSARIFELKRKGVGIGFEWLNVTNRYGEVRRVKRYILEAAHKERRPGGF